MIKIAFLCTIMAISYIKCNPTNTSNLIDRPILSTVEDNDQLKFLTSLNLSEIRTTQSENKPRDISGFYSWLSFLKTSTSTTPNNATILSKTQ